MKTGTSLRLIPPALIMGLTVAYTALHPSPAADAPADAPKLPVNLDPKAETELRSWFEPAEPIRIAGPIHFVGTRGLATYLISTAEGHILLFGAMTPSARLVEDNIRKLGFKPEDIRILLTCHAHVDHVGTHDHFQKLSGARVAMMAEEVALLESGGKTDFHYGHLPPFHFPPVKVDRVLRDGDQVKLGEVILTAHLTPGHTKGGTTWTTTAMENGKAYFVVFPDGTSVNPGYRLERHPSYPGIADDLRRTLHIHESLKPDIWLHSHTSFMDFEGKRARAKEEGVQAWVDPEGYRKFVISRREIVEKTIDAELAGPDISDGPWTLVRFTGDDGQGLQASDAAPLTAEFHTDGRAGVRIGVNRGSGSWKLGGWNEIVLGPMALTRAAGPPDQLADRLTGDWESLRKYELKDGKLILSLVEKGGRYEFEPAAKPPTK